MPIYKNWLGFLDVERENFGILYYKSMAKKAKKWKKEELALHQKFVEYGRNAKEWTRRCVLLLPEIEKRQIWRKKGFGSIYEYAAKLAGMSRNTVDDALRILKRIEDKPELQKVVEQKGINAVRPIVSIATVETAAFWSGKAMEMSKNTLETYIKELKKQEFEGALLDTWGGQVDGTNDIIQQEIFRTGTGNNAKKSQQAAISVLATELDPAVAMQLQKLSVINGWNTLMKELLELREQKLQAEKPAMLEATSRHIPSAIARYVLKRSGGTCEFGDCLKPYAILHHTQRFALEPVHDPDRIVVLCTAHERIAHHGLIVDERRPAHIWRLLREPEVLAPKYDVDRVVAKFRTGK